MPSVGVGVSITRSQRLQSAKHGTIASTGDVTERSDDILFFKDSDGKFFRVTSTKTGDGYAQLRTRE
tara:strand:- start:415 stop:615 length:201 start_codon:yes stop_codon:yes gene_type:complete